MNPRRLLRDTAARFRKAGIPDPENDSALLLSFLSGRKPLELRLDTDTVLDESLLRRFESLASERLERKPLQYITGEAVFSGMVFKVNRDVLIPRPETALLCEWGLELLADTSAPLILDLCCGSGCIGLTMKSRRPDAAIYLSDISEGALDTACLNASLYHLEADFCRRDLLAGEKRQYHMIISNPPYIPSSECSGLQEEVLYEPLLALDGGTDGLRMYARIARDAKSCLLPGGFLLMELGFGQAPAVSGLLKENGWSGITVRKDLNGIERMICAVKP